MKHRGDGLARRLLKRLLRGSSRPLAPEEASRLQEFQDWIRDTWRWGR